MITDQQFQQLIEKVSHVEAMCKTILHKEQYGDEVSMREAAELCRLSYRTMHTMWSNGKLNIPGVKRGKKLYFQRTDIVRWNSERSKRFNVRHINKAA